MRDHITKAPFTAYPNAAARNPDLSLRAKGALLVLLSHESGWVRSAIAILMRESGCGRDQAAKAMAELRAAGYAVLERGRNPKTGKVYSRYLITSEPQLPVSELADSPGDGKPVGRESETASSTAETSGSPGIRVPRDTETQGVEEEPLEEEPQLQTQVQEQELARAEKPRERPRDLIYEALFMVDVLLPYTPENRATLTRSAAGKLNRAAAEIRPTGISPEELVRAIEAWPAVMGADLACTSNGIAGNLPRLRAGANGHIARGNSNGYHTPSPSEARSARLAQRLREAEAAYAAEHDHDHDQLPEGSTT